jgi:hypothetical protein
MSSAEKVYFSFSQSCQSTTKLQSIILIPLTELFIEFPPPPFWKIFILIVLIASQHKFRQNSDKTFGKNVHYVWHSLDPPNVLCRIWSYEKIKLR